MQPLHKKKILPFIRGLSNDGLYYINVYYSVFADKG